MRPRLGTASICAKLTTLVLVSITATMSLLVATYTRVPSGLAATFWRAFWLPTVIGVVARVYLVAVLMTDTVLLPPLATYSRVPLIANALGEEPTPMFMEKMLGLASITLLVAVSITDTVLLQVVGHIQPPGAADRQRAG